MNAVLPRTISLNPKTSPVGSAIVLQGQTAAITAGTLTGVLNPNTLKNPLAYPILIDEIMIDNATGGNANGPGGGDLRIQLRVGAEEITAAYVPLWLLGKGRNRSVDGGGPIGNVIPSTAGSTYMTDQALTGMYSCRFSSELILYPGEILEPMFLNAGILTSTSYTPKIFLKGRVLPKDSVRKTLPYIAYFAGANQPCGANYTEQSTEANLNNPHDEPLYVERMVGVLGATQTPNGTNGLYSTGSSMDAGLQYCLLRMADGEGRPIIRDNTPFAHVFQLQDYCWEMRATMPPHSFWYAYLTENYGSIPDDFSTIQAFMSVIGKRPVKG